MKQKTSTDDQNIQHNFLLNCFPLSSFDHGLTFENSKKVPWPHYPLLNVMVMEMNLYYVKVLMSKLCSQ